MANLDISRHLLDRAKHYTGARMQQGRSLHDADWNEGARLQAEDLRETLVELLGAQGSSNAGFTVCHVRDATVTTFDVAKSVLTYDFDLHEGSLFIGGLRVQVEPGETFLTQVDWLQIDRTAANLPTRVSLDAMLPPELADPDATLADTSDPFVAPRYDLVYLEAWEHPVSAVEDAELRERGLGGPDSTGRIRRNRRIHVAESVASDVPAVALDEVMEALEADGVGTFDETTGEFLSAARLTVLPVAGDTDLCTPTAPAGYIGHEHQAIRVELRTADAIVWGFGNAAPLYRVKVSSDRKRLTFLHQPRDLALRPRAQQIVEVVAWGSKLPNDEKAAELTGELRRVAEAYDPGSRQLVLDAPLPAGMVAWLDGHGDHFSERDAQDGRYLYLRLWDRGGDLTSDPLISTVDTIVPLGNTGLQLRMSGAGRPGDYWIIAARKPEPELVVPWELLSSAAPFGPRRFYAPLALLCWQVPVRIMSKAERKSLDPDAIRWISLSDTFDIVWGPLETRSTDGRCRLEPLCVTGCCTVTVGDGAASEGMVNSLADALALVPDGGRICLLAGDHDAEVELDGRNNLTIVGCGPKSRLVNATTVSQGPTIYQQGTPLLTLTDCEGITLRDFALSPTATVGVKIQGATDECKAITLEGLRFDVDGSYGGVGAYALPQAAVLALGCDGLTVRGCEVEVVDVVNFTPALVLGGNAMRIEGNRIQAGTVEASSVADSMGGIHILSQSRDVRVEGNLIRGGWGHGIAFGHMVALTLPVTQTIDASTVWGLTTRMLGDTESNLRNWAPSTEPATTMGTGEYWTPAGAVVDLRITNNRVRGMGLAGISTGGFVDSKDAEGPRFIVAIDLDIGGNEILGNVQIEGLTSPRSLNCDTAIGGVTIGAALGARVHDNRIARNYNPTNTGGSAWNTPIAGVAVLAGQGVAIEDNDIRANGLEYDTAHTILSELGVRGGIAVCEVSAIRGYTFDDAVTGVTVVNPTFTVRTNDTALVVRGNQVSHPVGKALWVIGGWGPITIHHNSLHSLGDPVGGIAIPSSEVCYADPMTPIYYDAQGACVEVRNYAGYPGHPQTLPAPAFIDSSAPQIIGGPLSFVGNEVELDWQWQDGYAASVLLSSLDSVIVTDNVMCVDMNSPYSGSGGDPVHLSDIVAAGGGGANFSFVFANCWAGASSTVQASGNRFEEARFSCLFSYLGGHAAAFDDETPAVALTQTTGATLGVGNVASHCLILPGTGSESVKDHNTELYAVIGGCTAALTITAVATQAVCVDPS